MTKNKKINYSLDDYLADRQAKKAQTAIGGIGGSGQSYRRSGSAYANPSAYVTTPQVQSATVKAGQGRQGSSVIAPAQAVSFSPILPTQQQAATEEAASGETATGVKLLTSQDLRSEYLNQAMQNVLDVMNRRFQYRAKESPLYTILNQQYEREAEKAAGKAYAASVANTGGYGSTYATLAGAEARRQVMEGMDDQQLALYEAAREEFLSERESAADWYNQVKQMYTDQLELEEYDKLRAEEEELARSGLTETIQNAYNAASQVWDGTNETQVRSALRNQGVSDADIEATIAMLKSDSQAAITDSLTQFELNPTVSGAAELLANAKGIGADTAYTQQISATLTKSFTDAVDDLSTGYKVLGADQATWADMSDEEKSAAILANAGGAVKEGILSEKDYINVLIKDIDNDMKALKTDYKGKPGTITKGILANVEGLMALKDDKALSDEAYEAALYHIIDTTDISENFYKTEIPGKGTGYQIALKHNFRLESGETDALIEIMKVYGKREKSAEGRD